MYNPPRSFTEAIDVCVTWQNDWWWKKSGVQQLIFPSIFLWFTGFYTSQVVVWEFFHQQYEGVGCFIQIANFSDRIRSCSAYMIQDLTIIWCCFFLWESTLEVDFDFQGKLGVWQPVASRFSAFLVVDWPSYVEHLETATFLIVHNCHMTFQTRYGDDMRSRSHPCFRCHGPWTVFKTTKPSEW